MTVEQEMVGELREIRAELKHLNERFDEGLAHRDEMGRVQRKDDERRHKIHEDKLADLERTVKANERKLVAYSAIGTAAVVVAGLLVRLL